MLQKFTNFKHYLEDAGITELADFVGVVEFHAASVFILMNASLRRLFAFPFIHTVRQHTEAKRKNLKRRINGENEMFFVK